MRLLMLPARVTLRGQEPATVSWPAPSADPPSTTPAPPSRAVLQVLDRWRYDGRWWEHETRRDYYLLELQGGSTVEVFKEGEAWWVARTSD